VQSTIYYREEDQYLIDQLEEKANRDRKSKSACLLTILEEYFEAENKIGQILTDMGKLDREKLHEALDVQREQTDPQKLGEILVKNNYVEKVELERALELQNSTENGESL